MLPDQYTTVSYNSTQKKAYLSTSLCRFNIAWFDRAHSASCGVTTTLLNTVACVPRYLTSGYRMSRITRARHLPKTSRGDSAGSNPIISEKRVHPVSDQGERHIEPLQHAKNIAQLFNVVLVISRSHIARTLSLVHVWHLLCARFDTAALYLT